jgi:hypothetical protein
LPQSANKQSTLLLPSGSRSLQWHKILDGTLDGILIGVAMVLQELTSYCLSSSTKQKGKQKKSKGLGGFMKQVV